MLLGAAGLSEQPFRTHDKPLSTVSYGSHRDALKVLDDTCAAANGLSLLQAPPLSGKSTLIRHFAENMPDECAVAIVDGDCLNTTNLFASMLRQFGYVLDHSSPNELLAMLRVFSIQQAAEGNPPLLIIENAHALKPSALRALCELADLEVRRLSALKIVLVSDRSLHAIVEAPAMECIARRLTHDFHLRPMSRDETTHYLHAKLVAAGSLIPEFIFPAAVCSELWRASGGWPGILDRIALLALAKSRTLPVAKDQIERPLLPDGTWDDFPVAETAPQNGKHVGLPALYVSNRGTMQKQLTLDSPRLLIGRSEDNDLAIPSRYISQHHALLVRQGSSTILMDLNSSNGTFVNSKRTSNCVLVNDDVITIGNHRIKFRDSEATRRDTLDGIEFADTAIMKTLDDMRKLLAQENTGLVRATSDNQPTQGL